MDEPLGEFPRRRVLRSLGAAGLVGVAGCASFSGPETATGRSARITIALNNADDTERAYEVTVDWGGNNRSLLSGVLPPRETDSEMVAVTGTAPESAEFIVESTAGAQGGTWSPTDCPEYRVDAVIENGDPSFDAGCRA